MAIVKVRLKRGVNYFTLQPDGNFSKTLSAHLAGSVIPVLSKDAAELVSNGKAEYMKMPPEVVAPASEKKTDSEQDAAVEKKEIKRNQKQ